jgi:hypothetical protein
VSRARRVRWACPNGCAAVLGPTKPRRDDVSRYCLPCSQREGKLVPRVAPALEAERDRRELSREDAEKKAKARDEERSRAAHTIAGLDVREEIRKLWNSSVAREFRRPRAKPPSVKVRRAMSKPVSRYAWASVARHAIGITDYPGIDAADVKELLAHEVAHILNGEGRGHETRWKAIFRRLAFEVYGVRPRVESRYHGEAAAKLRSVARPPHSCLAATG